MSNSDKIVDVLRIDGKYYDTLKLAKIHPGGELAIRLSNQTDATALFNTSHRRAFPHAKYTQYLVPDSKVPKDLIEPMERDFTLFWELCEKIKPVLGNTKGFAPWHYWVKVAVILGVTWFLDVRAIVVGPVFALSLLQGLFAAFIGLNLQHDANHGAVSERPILNRLVGLTQDYIGGTALGWMMNHNVVHHVHCNDCERDKDIQLPLLRLSHLTEWHGFHMIQQFYFGVLNGLFGLVHVLFNFILIWRGPQEHQRLLKDYWWVHRAMSLIFPTRFALMVYFHGLEIAVKHIATVYCFGGAYLAFFFIMSHNFEGVNKSLDSTKGCFVNLQAETSSNVGGWLLAQFNGGLNYQIEHHLFPRIHHSFYPYLSPIVKQVCEREGIAYVHFPTIFENAWSTFLHMTSMGKKPTVRGIPKHASTNTKVTQRTNGAAKSESPKRSGSATRRQH